MSRTTQLGLAAALAVVVVLVLAWASIVSLAGAGPAAAATAFFKTIADKGAPAAYATTSPTFQHATPADAFAAAVQTRDLSDYRSSDWTVRGRQGDLAELSGAVNLKSGGVVPAELRLVKGSSGWQVLSLELPQGGLAGGPAAATTASATNETGSADYDSNAPTGTTATQTPPPPPAYPQPAAGQPGAPAGLIGAAPPPPPGAAPAGAPDGTTYGAAQAPGAASAGPMISRTRVARICGQTLMHNSWADTVQLHCPDPIASAPGSTTRCAAVVNGHRTGLTATLSRYDAAADDAQLTCRLD